MVIEETEIIVGDQVRVPWGPYQVDAEVLDLLNTPLGLRAIVRLMDSEEAETITLPADTLIKGPEIAGEELPQAIAYEEHLRNSLRSLLQSNVTEVEQGVGGDQKIDFKINLKGRPILIEAKLRSSSRKLTTDDVLAISGVAQRGNLVVLISNAPLTKAADARLHALSERGVPIFFSQWRDSGDDSQLAQTLEQAATHR